VSTVLETLGDGTAAFSTAGCAGGAALTVASNKNAEKNRNDNIATNGEGQDVS
jgi:hypothetical protein